MMDMLCTPFKTNKFNKPTPLYPHHGFKRVSLWGRYDRCPNISTTRILVNPIKSMMERYFPLGLIIVTPYHFFHIHLCPTDIYQMNLKEGTLFKPSSSDPSQSLYLQGLQHIYPFID